MFIAHAIYPWVWMTDPLQILQTQLQWSWIAQPLRRRQGQRQFVSV